MNWEVFRWTMFILVVFGFPAVTCCLLFFWSEWIWWKLIIVMMVGGLTLWTRNFVLTTLGFSLDPQKELFGEEPDSSEEEGDDEEPPAKDEAADAEWPDVGRSGRNGYHE